MNNLVVGQMVREALKEFRAQEAQRKDVPLYYIFQNKVIDLISQALPENSIDLLTIPGIGPKVANTYGPHILEIVEVAKSKAKIAGEGVSPQDRENNSEHAKQNETEQKIYSVGELLGRLNVWLSARSNTVCGEVFGNADVRGEYIYFTLKDEDGAAQMSCMIRKSVVDSAGVVLESGMKITVLGYLNVYKQYGKMSFIVQSFELSGEGILKQAYEKLKKKLEEEGLFEQTKKKPIPMFPKSIGLITAAGSDAERDFITHIPQIGLQVKRFDVRVEGVYAKDMIVDALRFFSTQNTIDVVVLCRGGGSTESLQAFNHEEVVRAVSECSLPIITGVGHEKDVTLVDFVSDARASTPTHAGKIVGQSWIDARGEHEFLGDSLQSSARGLLEKVRLYIQQASYMLGGAASGYMQKVMHEFDRVQESVFRIPHTLSSLLTSKIQDFIFVSQKKITSLSFEYKHFLETTQKHHKDTLKNMLQIVGQNIAMHESILEHVNPEQQLQKGYSYIKNKNGKSIRSINDIAKGEEVEIMLSDGVLDAVVQSIKK